MMSATTVPALLTLLCFLPLISTFNEEFYKEQQDEPSPTSLPSKVKLPPCQRPKPGAGFNQGKSSVQLSPKFKGSGNNVLEKGSYEGYPTSNCTEDGADDDGTSSEPIQYDHWKLHIIMACTVTAAVEFLLIIFIILYWRQIRWTLRKITCPCDRYRNGTHEAMEADDEDRNEFDVENIEQDSRPQNSIHRGARSATSRQYPILEQTRVQRYSAPRNSRVQSATYSHSEDLAVPGPSGLSQHSTSPSSSFTVIVHQYSSDESLSDVGGSSSAIQVSPSTRNQNKSSKGKAARGKCSSANKAEGEAATTDCDLLGVYTTQTAEALDPLGARPTTSHCDHSQSDTDLNFDLCQKGIIQTQSQILPGTGGGRKPETISDKGHL